MPPPESTTVDSQSVTPVAQELDSQPVSPIKQVFDSQPVMSLLFDKCIYLTLIVQSLLIDDY